MLPLAPPAIPVPSADALSVKEDDDVADMIALLLALEAKTPSATAVPTALPTATLLPVPTALVLESAAPSPSLLATMPALKAPGAAVLDILFEFGEDLDKATAKPAAAKLSTSVDAKAFAVLASSAGASAAAAEPKGDSA